MTLKIGLAQITPTLGDVKTNLDLHLEKIEEATGQGVELLIFPELSLTGYDLGDLAFEVGLRPNQEDPVFGRLLEASRRLDLVVSFVETDRRQRIYNAAAYLSGGELIHLHRKVYLPTYGMFDEGHTFARGDTVKAFDTRFGQVGLLICEDYWHVSPPYLLWLDGADIFIFISASPVHGMGTEGELNSAAWVDRIHQTYAGLFTNFIAHCNRTGFENGVNFWGGSTIYDPDGYLIVQGPSYKEALVTAELDLDQLTQTRARLPLLRDERMHLTLRELQRISQTD